MINDTRENIMLTRKNEKVQLGGGVPSGAGCAELVLSEDKWGVFESTVIMRSLKST